MLLYIVSTLNALLTSFCPDYYTKEFPAILFVVFFVDCLSNISYPSSKLEELYLIFRVIARFLNYMRGPVSNE